MLISPVCLLIDCRRLTQINDVWMVNTQYASSVVGSVSEIPLDEWTLSLAQRNRYQNHQSGTCSAIPLKNGGLLTAGHCIRSEWLPGSVLDAGHITATVWKQIKTQQIDGQPMLKLDAEKTWQSVELVAGKFKTNGPDWALLKSNHNLPGYEIASHSPQVDTHCYITGYPLGLSLREVASGKVIQPMRESEHFFWLDCRVSNGVSGAPVVDKNKQLVGIVCGETTTDNGIYTRVQKTPKEVI